jgi:hypothetical protein
MGEIQDPLGLFAKNLDDFAKGNEGFVSSFKDGDKPMPPGRKIAIVTCMDARWSSPAVNCVTGLVSPCFQRVTVPGCSAKAWREFAHTDCQVRH